jgi:hypothetical protein
MMAPLNRITQWIKSIAEPTIAPDAGVASSYRFDPSWHGDHWQNLLSSPMDARHYVMEDWATPPETDVVTQESESAATF